MSDETREEQRSYELRTQIEDKLSELAELWGPEDTVEYVENVAARMRDELDEEPGE